MSKYVINDSTLVAIGDAVREKDGTTAPIVVSDLANRIKAIPSGGEELPEEAFTVTGVANYRFSNNGWNWFIRDYGNRIKTENITSSTYMFSNSDELEEIPFEIYIGNNNSYTNFCYYCEKLKAAPVIKKQEGTTITGSSLNIGSFFENCYEMRTISNDFFNNFITAEEWESFKTKTTQMSRVFNTCRFLREIPDMSNFSGKYASYSYSSTLYYYGFQNCYSLNKITNLPVKGFDFSAFNSNAFTNTFPRCSRINRLTFQTNEDGSPIVTTWKNQSIDLTTEVGYAPSYYSYFKEAGITEDKEVKDDATYQALKNDEDWYSKVEAYCRYNKTSALETISTLPDVSAGSNNSIKFRGNAGASTDGGAINTMTEEEIAVATAKGWTVSFV